MNIGIVGCGYVADFYVRTLRNYSWIKIAGVADQDRTRADRFAAFHSLRCLPSFEAMLSDSLIETVVNLTNPLSHKVINKQSLEAGKHVYSEKPLALTFSDVKALFETAEKYDLKLAAAPCSVLGESAQTLWAAIREGRIGHIRVAHAELEDGPIHRMPYRTWKSASGALWPFEDEFRNGSVLEHSLYHISWLAAFLGPASSVAGFSLPAKLMYRRAIEEGGHMPDATVCIITFRSGAIARLTCGRYATRNRSFVLVGDEGELAVEDCWDYGSPVYLTLNHYRSRRWSRITEHLLRQRKKRIPLVKKPDFGWRTKGAYRMDFARGLAELGSAIEEGGRCRLSADYTTHISEIALGIEESIATTLPYTVTSSFEPIDAMPWAP